MGPRQTTTYNLRIILSNSAPISVACLPLDVTNRLGVLVCSIVKEKILGIVHLKLRYLLEICGFLACTTALLLLSIYETDLGSWFHKSFKKNSLSSSRCNKQTSEVLVCSIVEEKKEGLGFV